MDERDDQLRARLARLDPTSRAASTDPTASAPAPELLETIMQTTESQPTPDTEPRSRRGLLLAAAAVIVLVVLAVGVIAIAGDDDDSGEDVAEAPADEPTELDLTVAPSDPLAICIQVDATVLEPSELAFAGTVGEVTDSSVTVDVDHWYKGGDADVVNLAIAEGNDVALDGIAFTSGERYLVAASGGTVSSCGLSGPASPELEAIYTDA